MGTIFANTLSIGLVFSFWKTLSCTILDFPVTVSITTGYNIDIYYVADSGFNYLKKRGSEKEPYFKLFVGFNFSIVADFSL